MLGGLLAARTRFDAGGVVFPVLRQFLLEVGFREAINALLWGHGVEDCACVFASLMATAIVKS